MVATVHSFEPAFTRGDRLAKAREHAGLTQGQMAVRLGVSKAAVTKWETDRAQPRDMDVVMERWSDETGVSLAWLYGVSSRRFLSPQYARAG